MTTILSIRALAALVERYVHEHGPHTEADVLRRLVQDQGVDTARAQRAVELAIARGRIHHLIAYHPNQETRP